MTEYATSILEVLKSGKIEDRLRSFIGDEAVYWGDLPIRVYYDQFLQTKTLLIYTIETGAFDEQIPYITRKTIAETFSQVEAQTNNIRNVIANLDGLNREIALSGLKVNSTSGADIQQISKDLNALKHRSRDIDKSYRDSEETLTAIGKAKRDYEQFFANMEGFKNETAALAETAQKKYLEISTHTSQADIHLKSIKEVEAEIDSKKLSISSFATNIDEYKTTIDSLETKANEVISKEETIVNLIAQAETALQLREAQGISAAFANQYTVASNKTSLYGWIVGGVVCLGAAVIFTTHLLSDTTPVPKAGTATILSSYPWLVIVGRAVIVSICLSAAAFAARQYTKQKNLAEDYAYKAAVSKSIVAFTAEIKKHDESKVSEYLTKVLEEVHQDPLRSKLTKADGLSTWDLRSFTEKIAELLTSNKT